MKPYPPLLFGGGMLLALIGHLVYPLSLPGAWWLRGLGAVLMVAAGALALSAERQMVRAATPVMPFQDARALVTTGPFRFSRNPIYLSFTIATCGLALLTASWWVLIVLPLVLIAITGVIRGEEQRLHRIFGEDYARYRARTRRWL